MPLAQTLVERGSTTATKDCSRFPQCNVALIAKK